jgi:adenine-specific DNA-methyltransferase
MSAADGMSPAPSPIEYRLGVLGEIFPEIFKEGCLDSTAVLEFVGDREAYEEPENLGLRWPGRSQAIESLKRPAACALEPLEGFLQGSSHVFISGDNYDVMKLLQPAYGGSVKMAFIEPPYNNGQDEIYADDFEDPADLYRRHVDAIASREASPALLSTSGRGRHSRWLTMMLPRLYVTRNLLSDDGVVFVTIDDHESHRLRLLMDEIFGPENFVCTFVWEKRYSPAPDAENNVGYVHEYILCYRRTPAFEASFLPMSDSQRGRYRNPDDDTRGPWKPADYTCRYTAEERPNLYYAIRHPRTGEEIWPKRSRVWACTEEEHERQKTDKRIWWGADLENTVPARKAFLSEIRQGLMPATLLKHTEVGHTDDATKEIRKFFPELSLTPKPVALIRHLIKISGASDGDVIFDPFARVGTTAEAVLAENEEMDSDLRFMLIGLPELVQGAGEVATLPEVALERARQCVAGCAAANQRLRVFRQRSPVLFLNGANAGSVGEATDYFDTNASGETLVVNLALVSGYTIDGPIEQRELLEGVYVYIFGGALGVCVSRKLSPDVMQRLADLPLQRIVCLEAGFGGKEELLINTRRAFADRGISFETI